MLPIACIMVLSKILKIKMRFVWINTMAPSFLSYLNFAEQKSLSSAVSNIKLKIDTKVDLGRRKAVRPDLLSQILPT